MVGAGWAPQPVINFFLRGFPVVHSCLQFLLRNHMGAGRRVVGEVVWGVLGLRVRIDILWGSAD